MKNYLDDVKKYCFDLEKSGKVVPIKLDYPSFTISMNDFRKLSLDYTTERVKIGLLTNSYNNKKFDIDYNKIFDTEERSSLNISTLEDAPVKIYIEKILPIVMKRDENLEGREVSLNCVRNGCVSAMQLELLELENLRTNSVLFERSYQSSYIVDKNKFAATMLMLKKQLPHAYNAVDIALKTSGLDVLVKELKDMENHPDISIVKIIYEADKKLAVEHYAPQVKMLLNLEQQTNSIHFSY